MDSKKIKIRKAVAPQKIIHNGDIYQIMDYPDKYFIKGYTITLIDGRIDDVYINGKHPNAESSGKFCLPNELRKIPYNSDTKQLLETILSQYNLNNCYFTPWNEIQYKKQEV